MRRRRQAQQGLLHDGHGAPERSGLCPVFDGGSHRHFVNHPWVCSMNVVPHSRDELVALLAHGRVAAQGLTADTTCPESSCFCTLKGNGAMIKQLHQQHQMLRYMLYV